MSAWKNILHKVLFPSYRGIACCVVASAVLLSYTFLFHNKDSPIAYVAYVFSAYTLVIVCASVTPFFRRSHAWARSHPLLGRYFDDAALRVETSLYLSFAIDIAYAAGNAFFGIWADSVWFGTMAVYYIFLSIQRFLLVRFTRQHGFGSNEAEEWRRYRVCGVLLAMMHAALVGVVVLAVGQEGGVHYPGSLIYAVALYAFYSLTMAIVNVVRYRRYRSPVMIAEKIVSLVTACVSMLSLEIAMLTQFDDGTRPWFRPLMIALSGGAIGISVVGIGVFMVVRATRRLHDECERSM